MSDPKPGSPEAVKAGCKCPVMDNAQGKGRGGCGEDFGWWVNARCELHGKKKDEPK